VLPSVFEMQLHEFDELPAACLRASGLVGAFEKVHDVFAGRTAVALAMRDEKDVALVEGKLEPAREASRDAFSLPWFQRKRGKWPLAFWL